MLDKIEAVLNEIERPEINVEELVQWKTNPVTQHMLADFIDAYMLNLEKLSEMIPCDDVARAEHAAAVGEQGIIKQLLDYYDNTKSAIEGK